jgi:hypothetical protein
MASIRAGKAERIANKMADQLRQAEARNAELEAELRSILKWAKLMGYIDLQERLRKLLADKG